MGGILVIRFGSLGDLCLLGGALARRRDGLADGYRVESGAVTLVTKPAFADLMRHFRGIDAVVTPRDTSLTAVAALARRLAHEDFGHVIDAHQVLRSRWLLACLGRRPHARLAKDTAARLALLRTRRPSPSLQRTMSDRFDELFVPVDGPRDRPLSGRPAGGPPATALPPLQGLPAGRGPGAGGSPVLGLAPGAQWDTKRWPAASFADLMARFLARRQGGVRIFLGPREQGWFAQSPLGVAAHAEPRVQVILQRSLPEVAAMLAGCRVLATNDSGLLHLAEAVGTPVLALFGPTVREFGYYPVLPASRVLETDLDCRPCSRNGKRPCHRGDLACLARITPASAWEVLQEMLDHPHPGEAPGGIAHEGSPMRDRT